MGFHKAKTVYAQVDGTTSTQQAVLAYLALMADDKGMFRCYRSDAQIAAATHFKRSAIAKARKGLQSLGLLEWAQGGRKHGGGGSAEANEYFLVLPQPKDVGNGPASVAKGEGFPAGRCPPNAHGSVRDVNSAVSTKNAQQCPPGGHHQMSSAVAQKSIHSEVRPGGSVDFEAIGTAWIGQQRAGGGGRMHEIVSVVDEAMKASGATDDKSRQFLTATIRCRDANDCLETIRGFATEVRLGWHEKAESLPAVLNSQLARLPWTKGIGGR